ncbi:MAG: pyruvate kinase [Desulfobulbaceae bacterium]|uniref:Pyruvate kinase n=1 Tax=Candidatus Desulfobia pelagia TaxID=2841692 RepID=A0A8J6TFN8_9BACT|nr:pyruvate kinase [Candidatus Desulfobia pelagia]
MRVLVVEDSEPTRLLVVSRLAKEGHDVDFAENGRQGFLKATSNQYDVLISDIFMPEWDGFKFISAMKVVSPHLPIIVVSSSYAEKELRDRLHEFENIVEILPKPIDFNILFNILKTIKVQTHNAIRKMARIVCTIGPASDSPEMLGRMIVAGMDVARLNFSHGTHEQHEKTLNSIRKAEKEWGKPIAIMQDLCGPKIRTGKMPEGGIVLKKGQFITVQADPVEGNSERFSTIVPEIIPDLRLGEPVLLDDGLIELKVVTEGEREAECVVIVGGVLKSNKGMNLPVTKLSIPSVTEKDRKDLEWGLKHSVDYVALSFVRSPEEILEIKEIIYQAVKGDIKVVAKIEKQEAVEHIQDIIDVSDVIMIARGDMGVELPAVKVPRIQQEIIRMCWESNTPVITATQMLDSMTHNIRPTRAEVTDVSVAIRSGTDAVMLSGETAVGVDPLNVVRTMASIICEEEQYSTGTERRYRHFSHDLQTNPAIMAAASMIKSAATMLIDRSGKLYPQMSKWNRKVPSLLVTRSLHVARQSSMYHNIVPIIIDNNLTRDEMLLLAVSTAKEWGYLKPGDVLVVVEGGRLTQGDIPQLGAFQLVHVE